MFLLHYLLCIFLLFCVKQHKSESAFDVGQVVFSLFHSLEPGPIPKYELRGFITINSEKDAFYVQDEIFSSDDIARLKKLALTDDFYRIKLVDNIPNSENSPHSEERAIFSFTKACGIYQSGWSEEITVSLDQGGHPTGIAISAVPPHCTGEPVPDSKFHTFNTTVHVINLVSAPMPDTLTYIQRLEQEKAEKARGEQGDNRSFFAKYWMYIVPLVIFLFLSGASGPEGQGGGR